MHTHKAGGEEEVTFVCTEFAFGRRRSGAGVSGIPCIKIAFSP